MDHVTAEKMNLEDVSRYFEKRGYRVEKLNQPWRHVKGELFLENEKLFLKLASTSWIGERTKNEADWDKKTNSNWSRYIKTFRSPKIFDEGDYEGKYWFICEYVFGKPLAEVTSKKINLSEKDLLKTAEIAKEIMGVADFSLLPKDKEHFRELWVNKLIEISSGWSKETKTDTRKLLQFIKEKANNLQVASSHGDFTPWHILKNGPRKFYLIDSEAAQVVGVKYYDAAYFYHRVYTKIFRPDLADLFLKSFKGINGWSEKEEATFKIALASRVMGGYFDAERDGVTSLDLNRELEEKLLR